MNIDNHIIKRFIMKVYPFMILCSKFIEQNKLVRKIQYEWISQPIRLLFKRQAASQPCFNLCSAARHCEIRPPACENLLSSDFLSDR